MMGAGALLASYSRDNEREADALGMEYMVKTGYSSNGFVGLMEMLQSLSKHQPNAIQLMFSTHPMSTERYQTAVEQARSRYGHTQALPLGRERYMDHTSRLRTLRGAIEAIQRGEDEMAGQRYDKAEAHFKKALSMAPDDYAGLVMMAKCQLALNRYAEALQYAESAKAAYPQEAQAYHLAGFTNIRKKRFGAALQNFSSYEARLPGNPNAVFFKGLSLEGMNRKKDAANHYYRYLQTVRQGQQATYAHKRLVDWGYIR